MGFLQTRPERRELFRPKVREDFAVHVNHRRQFLTGKPDHFVVGRLVGEDVDRFVINAVIVQPTLGSMAPRAVILDEKSNSFWLHGSKSPTAGTNTTLRGGI